LCNRYSITTILDPKLKDFKSYKGVSYIKPNRREAEDATGIVIRTEVDILNACMKVQEITACNAVFLTLSADGIALYMNGGIKIFPAIVHDIIDVTGAGDTVLASLGYCLLNNKSLPEACMFANKAASIVIQKVGSATASIDEVLI
jgi:D-beta-D-heptose 7-phosphate kinase/D-beta-D-heptose 1-phosphate adenosyltransferase